MPDLVRGIVRPHLKELSDKDLGVMIEDCGYQARMNLYGDERIVYRDERIDTPGWMKWAEELKTEKKRRAGGQDA